MGGGEGIGMEASSPATLTGVGHRRPESAGPITSRLSKSVGKARGPCVPLKKKLMKRTLRPWTGGSYVVAIYDVPGVDVNQTALPFQLKKDAFLKLEGKKDLRASRVDLLPQEGGLATIVFMFPRSEEITTQDQRITFLAQLGRLSVAQYFYPAEMTIQGKLEL